MQRSQDLQETIGLLIHHATDPVFFWITCFIIVVILLLQRKVFEACVFALAIGLTTIVTTLLKMLFAVERPADALVTLSTYSFPSGHASASTALAVTIVWILLQQRLPLRRRTIFVGGILMLALLISWSRIAIGVHTFLDISVGILLGILIPACVIYLCIRSKKRPQKDV